MFNGYEDSEENEKANQEAYERSLHFTDEAKEDRLKKLGFLSNRSNAENEEPDFLIKPRIEANSSPKIEIENQFFQSLDRNKNEGNIIDSYQHEPIEFVKADNSQDNQNEKAHNFESIEPTESENGQEHNVSLRRRDEKDLQKQEEEKQELLQWPNQSLEQSEQQVEPEQPEQPLDQPTQKEPEGMESSAIEVVKDAESKDEIEETPGEVVNDENGMFLFF